MVSTQMQLIGELFRAARTEGAEFESLEDIPARRQEYERIAPPTHDDVAVIDVDAGGVRAEWVLAPDADGDRRLLYLHGGGYLIGSRDSHRRLASDISRASGCAVLSIDYRLAPEHLFPAAFEDALSALRWMRSNGVDGEAVPTSTFIAGDSAGGGLTLATLVATRDAGEPLPNAAVTLSAWTDLAATGESLRTRADVDPVASGDRMVMAAMAAPYLGDADPASPLASPLYADLAGLPPMLLQVGDCEVLLDDTTRVAERARAAGVDVTLEIEPGAFHVYQFFATMIPEARTAIYRIGAFIRAHG